MVDTHTEYSGLETWSTARCPFRIEYAPRALDDIRLVALDAFVSPPHGGVEIGGVLLGKMEPGRLTIVAYAPLACEHDFGPSFLLSAQDRTRLGELLDQIRKYGPDLQPVGWYRSHSRGAISLSDADLEIHNRYFPESWQIALIVQPSASEPARAGFFFREADGSIHAGASYQEFALAGLPVQPAPAGWPAAGPAVPALAGQPVPTSLPAPRQLALLAAAVANGAETPPQSPVTMESPAAQSSREPAASAEEKGPSAPEPTSTSASQTRGSEPRPGNPREWAGSGSAIEQSPGLDRLPSFAQAEPESRRGRLWAAALAAAIALSGAFVYRQRGDWLPHAHAATVHPMRAQPGPPLRISLSAAGSPEQLRILWDAHSPAVTHARGAVLQIRENGQSVDIPLDAQQLYAGAFLYSRKAEHVDAKLRLDQTGGAPVEAIASFQGPIPVAPAPPAADPPPAQPAKQDAALGRQAAEPSQKNTQLAQQNTSLTQQNTQLAQQNAQLLRQKLQLTGQNTDLAQQNTDLRQQKEELAKQAARLKIQLAAATEHARKLADQLDRQQRKRLENQSFIDPLQ